MNSMSALERGRQALDRNNWPEAFAQLSAADREAPLDAADLEQLGFAGFLVGHDSIFYDVLARAHHDWLARGETARAARCAFWLAFGFIAKGQRAPASGWLARAKRLLDHGPDECVERGYMLLPAALESVAAGDIKRACATFTEAARIGEQFGDIDLMTLARQGQGRTLIVLGSVAEGVTLMDEVMIAVTTGEVSPIVVGTVYCSVIEACHEMFDLRRAHEWTAALGRWCESQTGVVPYRGHCLVRRAEILQLHGSWPDAMEEVERACTTLSAPTDHPSLGAALYQRAELHRLCGEFQAAEDAYRESAQRTRRPLPGLALLRLAQGQIDGAVATIARVLENAGDRRYRPRVLAAYVEIALAAHDARGARAAGDELKAIASEFNSAFLNVLADSAEGAILLAEGDARAALSSLQRALNGWSELEAPYEAARIRTLIGLAYRALADADAARAEFDIALNEFERLGAVTERTRVLDLARAKDNQPAAGLTSREVEVLRLLATGKTNRAIADELGISEKTVARHVSNIFNKLDLSSRAGATAYAYQHDLIAPHT